MPLPALALLGAAAGGAVVREAVARYRWTYSPSSSSAPPTSTSKTQEVVLVQASVVASVSAAHVKRFVEGLCVGFCMSELPDLRPTIAASEEVYAELTLAFSCLRNKGGEEGLLSAIGHLSHALRYLQEALKDAEDLAPELQHCIDVFRFSPHTIAGTANKVYVNGKEIFAELKCAMEAWHQGHFETSGECVGKALAKLVD